MADDALGLAALQGPHSVPEDTEMSLADQQNAVEEAKSPDNTRAGAILSNAATPTGQDGRPSNWSRLHRQKLTLSFRLSFKTRVYCPHSQDYGPFMHQTQALAIQYSSSAC